MLLKILRGPLPRLKKIKMADKLNELVKEFAKVKIVNKGTGAGGYKTNFNGKKFEEYTNNESRLLENGYIKTVYNKNTFGYYLSKKTEDPSSSIVFVLQDGFKPYMKKTFDIDISFKPDEAYIITHSGKTTIKILEKKNQNCEGSVDTKLVASYGLRCMYEYICGENFNIEYSLCLSEWFKEHQKDKYIYTNMFLDKHNINVFYSDENYFINLDSWINN